MKLVLMKQLEGLLQPKPLITIFTLVVLGVVLLLLAKKSKFNTRIISYGAMCITASFLLSFCKIFELPNGGTITVASMLPLFIFAAMAGPWAGITAGLCYGMLQFIQEPYFVHPIQFLLDYPLAFAALGMAGFFRKNMWLGAIAGGVGRLVFHLLSGMVFFAEYANGQNVFIYSLSYNASYLVPELVVCVAVMLAPTVRSAISRVAFGREIAVK